jgi:biopolymer transport protein ExbB
MNRLARLSLFATFALLVIGVTAAFAQEAAPRTDPMAWTSSPLGWIKASGVVGWIIVVLSVVVGALIIEGLVTIKREKLAPPALYDELEALIEEKNYQEAMELCESQPCFLSNVVAAGLLKVGHPFETIEKATEEIGEEEALKLHQKVGWLSVNANIAPMLGLLGTVQGMIGAFNTIAAKRGQANPADFAADIAVALLTTLFGLLVAIPVTGVFAYMRNRVIKLSIDIGAMVADLFERFREKA